MLGRQVYLYNMYYLQIGPNSNLIKYIVLRTEKESSAFFFHNKINKTERDEAKLTYLDFSQIHLLSFLQLHYFEIAQDIYYIKQTPI